MRHLISIVIFALAAAGSPRTTLAQAAGMENELKTTVENLFRAMRASDTAKVRSAFLATARVVPIPPSGPNAKFTALSLDDFVTFAGRNQPEAWIERVWNPVAQVDGSLGTLWFDYDVYRNGQPAQCGVNAVQLVQTVDGWRIMSMAFTSRNQGCPTRPSPISK